MRDILAFYPYVIVRLKCDACTRQGSYRLARLAAKLGPEAPMDHVLNRLTVDCHYHDRVPGRQMRCNAYLVDLRGPPRPPDLPPGLAPLRVVRGGKSDSAPAEAGPAKQRATGRAKGRQSAK